MKESRRNIWLLILNIVVLALTFGFLFIIITTLMRSGELQNEISVKITETAYLQAKVNSLENNYEANEYVYKEYSGSVSDELDQLTNLLDVYYDDNQSLFREMETLNNKIDSYTKAVAVLTDAVEQISGSGSELDSLKKEYNKTYQKLKKLSPEAAALIDSEATFALSGH